MRLACFALAGVVAAGLGLPAGPAEKRPSPAQVDFSRQIRPILADNCFACHGPDEQTRKAGFRLDGREDAFKASASGSRAIVPGDLAKSALVQRITTEAAEDRMPPAKTGKKLTAEQIELLKRWVTEGANWDSHWAFQAPARPTPPEVQAMDQVRNPIDQFVFARLEKEGLAPRPEADRTTLVRRATLDLTGLPPTPAEVDAFLADNSAEAYEKLADRLLASSRYGEHMAHYWLDAARYADSHGYHIDSERRIWKYRDWVVDAFNRNLPFDQFTRDQLAGDLVPEPTLDQKIASGYLRCNMSTGEGGAIVEEYQAKYAFDRVETTSATWLGLTLVCARCHSHKYDPITQKEYYGLYAFFNSLDESVMDGNQPDPAPVIRVPSAPEKQRRDELQRLIAEGQPKLEAAMPDLDPAQADWESRWRKLLRDGWAPLKPERVVSTNGTEFKLLEDTSVLASGPNPPKDTHEMTVKLAAGDLAALRLEAIPDESLPKKSAARAEDGGFRLSELEAELVSPGQDGAPGQPAPIKLVQVFADSAHGEHGAALAIDGKPETGWQPDPAAMTAPHAAVFLPEQTVAVPEGALLRMRLRYQASTNARALGRFRLAAARQAELVEVVRPPKAEPWQLLGPLKASNLQEGFTASYEPEKEVNLQKPYPGVREEIRWQAKPDYEDGRAHVLVDALHGVHGVYYLSRTLRLPKPRRVELSVRADDLFKLWVNGAVAAVRAVKERLGEGPVKVVLGLPAGKNKFLLKIVNHQGPCHFTFSQTVCDRDALPLDLAMLFATTAQFRPDHQARVRTYFRRFSSDDFRRQFDQVEQWRGEDKAMEEAMPTTLVAKEKEKPAATRLLMRGEYDRPGEEVRPAVPAVLPPFPPGAPTNRLGLAQWLLDPAHPLTARVTVNRFWQQYFGVGLVKTSEDFGVQGEPPSHPELLDWLARELVESGWDVKRLQRLFVTSATYRQSSRGSAELFGRDPENRLLARGPRFRMDGEVLRDTALAVSGLLAERRGGPSVKPYEPPGLWEAVSYNNSQKYVPDTGEGQYRRSLYTHWKRQSPPPSMLLFDASTREFCVVRRPRTNTPLQALVMLNDPQFVEAARALAQRIMLEGGPTPADRVRYAFRLATARAPAREEIELLVGIYQQQLAGFRADAAAAKQFLGVGGFAPKPDLDAGELAAWATVAGMLLNLDETVTKS